MSIGRESESSDLELEQRDSGWNAATLRGACLMLSRTNPESVARISVNVHCSSAPEATRWLCEFTARLAGEYGLSAEIGERASGVCVVFTRSPIGA